MKYVYKTLTNDRKNELLVGSLMAKEEELFMYEIDKGRFEALLAYPDTPEEGKKFAEENIKATDTRIAEVMGVINKIELQLPEKAVIDSTVNSIKAIDLSSK